MDKRSRSTSPSLRRTTFLVPNIHCPTCASFVEDFLLCLRPRPVSVVTSIVTHSVTVNHDASLSTRTIAKALGEAGYEVDTVVSDPLPGEASPNASRGGADDDFPFAWLNQAVERWNRRKNAANEETKRLRHIEHCEQCRAQQREAGSQERTPSSRAPSDTQTAGGPFVVVESASALSKVLQASISITGMSCSSCVGKITAALEQKPWVRSANVALLTQSATVEFDGVQNVEELLKAIEGLGYEASLEHVEELPPAPGAGPRAAPDLWKASYSIGGMTCSSCVSTITKALESFPWTKSVGVNLITNSGTLIFEDKSHLSQIAEAIEGVGYTAKLSDVISLGKSSTEQDGRRTVSIRIDGMYCQHCPSRVTEALNSFGPQVTIDKVSTLGNPIMTISYSPNSPDFTIRAILSAIAAADQAFRPAIYHPPTVEERARQMHARIRQRILYRVLLSVVVAIPAFIIGIVYMNLIPPSNPGRQYLMEQLRGVTRAEWALLIMATPVYFFAADVFHRRTVKELHSLWKHGSPVPILRRFYRFGSMDMLMSFGTTIAYCSSVVELIIAATLPDTMGMEGNSTYFDSVVFLTMFLLIGRLIEAYSKAKTGEAVTMLGKLRPEEALLVLPDDGQNRHDRTQSVNIDMLDFGDMVRVVHGGSPPWDGILLDGDGEFDESSLTGESRLVKKITGDPIYSGTVNKGGPVSIRITGTSGNSMLDQIIKVVREGQARRAPIERMADLLTSYFVPVVTLIAIATWLVWLGLGLSGTLPEEYLDIAVGGWPFWSLQFAIAVFIIACPCGIGLAAPTALFVGGGLAAKHGILVKGGGEAFQEASGLDIIVFDKTGTLTQGGEPKITDHQFSLSDGSLDEQTTINILGELEGNSSHPIGNAIVGFCKSRDARGAKSMHIEEIPGKGMKGSFTVEALPYPVEVLAGNEALMADHGISFGSAASATLGSWKGQAKSVVLVAARSLPPAADSSWIPLATFAASDPLRPESRPVVEELHRLGVDVWMISGDNPTTAQAVGAMVGISPDHIIAGVLPEQKADKIKYLQRSQVKSSPQSILGFGRQRTKQRAIVAMVGDGVNDSPALTVADVGIAIGSGSDVAISAAEFILIKSNLTTLLTLVSLSRAVFRRVKFNFGWALVYNLVALPIAAGVLYPVRSGGQHIRLDPVWASLAMALSSVSVICSSLLLRSRLPVVGFRNDRALGQLL
ncbi:heavy metal translocatin [Coniochaeta ligniaria NRRL 30616]|uniref:Heavy metal translocatin n=1 Tax=Coniochaeta ligniaria NRRL 30616 TaxID=1408157 RepID=A0A1J7JBN9_9PEZI|nr:heavy metal translocatin [Coniochaeta ligniaria NRRL 30616]